MKIRLRMPKFPTLPKFPAAEGRVGRLAIGMAWIVGGLTLMVAVFGVSFFFAMRTEMRSNEVQVPDLTGMTFEAATHDIEAAELVLEVVDQRHDPTVPSGRILQQAPPAKVSVRRGRKIKLVMSLGGKVLEVPNLVGQAARSVEINLKQGGFVPGDEARISSATAANGTVIGQVPPPLMPAVPASRVHRLVSSGPEISVFVMPDLSGMERASAEAWLKRNGFRRGAMRRVSMSGHAVDEVVGQLPLPGYPVRSNDVIDLTIAQ